LIVDFFLLTNSLIFHFIQIGRLTYHSIRLKARAKLNLFLYVMGRYPNGYHDLRSLCLKLSLHDRLKIRASRTREEISSRKFSDIRSVIRDVDGGPIMLGSKDLSIIAAEKFFESIERWPTVCYIDIEKNIPIGAGLGGGSSDAAAVLMGLNALYGTPIGEGDLVEIGRSVGADVPFALSNGICCLMEGVGERITPVILGMKLHLVIIYPGFQIQTSSIFRHFATKYQIEGRGPHREWGPSSDISSHIAENDLYKAAKDLYPDLENSIALLKSQAGCVAAGLSGSGSACFGVFDTEQSQLIATHIIHKNVKGLWVRRESALI